jgi:hypothetical protein
MRHGLHFLVVTCPAVLPNLVQDEVFQTGTALVQLVEIFFDISLEAYDDHSYVLTIISSCILGLQKQGRGHAKMIYFVSYTDRPRNPSGATLSYTLQGSH